MAVTFNKNLMGKMTIKQNDQTFDIEIHQGNCLAVFIYKYKNELGEKYVWLVFIFCR